MKKIISITLVIFLLVFSTGIGFAFHYCGGTLAQFKVVLGYGEATCGMEMESNCENHLYTYFEKTTCCNDKFIELNADEYTSKQNQISSIIEFTNVDFLSDLSSSRKEFESDRFQPNRPPPKINSVSLPLIQTFII